MNLSYLFMAVFVAGLMTVGFAYAERSVVEVPFDYDGHGCTFDQEQVVYTCKWQGSSETISKELITESGVISPEQIAEESKEAHEEAIAIEEGKEQTPTERQIAVLKVKLEDGTISSADLILYDLLVDLKDSCELGIEHGALIQQYNEFELPVSDPRTAYKAIDFSKNVQLGNIIKKIEECKGWDKYRVDVLGQRYLDIEKVGVNNQVHHQEMVTDKGTYPTQKLTDESFAKSQSQAEESICKASFYDAQFKKERGCENAQVKVNDGEGITMDDTEPMIAYRTYMSTGGNVDMESLKKQEVTKYKGQSLEAFANLHGIDLADLKNLVQGDKP